MEENLHSKVFCFPWHRHVRELVCKHTCTCTRAHTLTYTIIYRNYENYIVCDIYLAKWKKFSYPGMHHAQGLSKETHWVHYMGSSLCLWYSWERNLSYEMKKLKSQASTTKPGSKLMWVEQTCQSQSPNHSGSKKELRIPWGQEKNC